MGDDEDETTLELSDDDLLPLEEKVRDELIDMRRETRRNMRALEALQKDIATALTAFASVSSRLSTIEGRLLAIECEQEIRSLPESKRTVARRLLIAERPTDVDAFIRSIR